MENNWCLISHRGLVVRPVTTGQSSQSVQHKDYWLAELTDCSGPATQDSHQLTLHKSQVSSHWLDWLVCVTIQYNIQTVLSLTYYHQNIRGRRAWRGMSGSVILFVSSPVLSPGLHYTGQTVGLPRQLSAQHWAGSGQHWVMISWHHIFLPLLCWHWHHSPHISTQSMINPMKRIVPVLCCCWWEISCPLYSVLITLTVTPAAAGQDPRYDSRTSSASNQQQIRQEYKPQQFLNIVSVGS